MVDRYEKTVDGRDYLVKVYPTENGLYAVECWLGVTGDRVHHWRVLSYRQTRLWRSLMDAFDKEIKR
ncbi:hypothetical protein FB001_10858 [Ensifer sp. SEMIA 135]|nr:hypothetical protein FB000_10958 [Ensifer sp. SEMIA 134]TWB35555.1 hypothetical protein FB001_10858 [Ensifer sp. SEMIA 135]